MLNLDHSLFSIAADGEQMGSSKSKKAGIVT